jgi:mannitol-1-phosphate/altronate dehydrogenase
MSSSSSYAWYPSSSVRDIDCLCLGTGRFLRSVLVPALVGAGLHPALIQTRGRSMLEYMQNSDEGVYEIDTVTPSGDVETTRIPIYGAFTLGSAEGKHHVLQELIPSIATAKKLSVLGVGVTEAGLSSSATQVMKDLYEILQCIQKNQSTDNQKLCIIDMDNIPNNGQVIRKHMMELASSSDEGTMTTFLQTKVVFMNTMVDRITSQRDGDPMIPKCEPVPKKALVVLDSDNDLPTSLTTLDPNQYGVVIRTTSAQLQGDIALKLRVANGTHTAIAHVLALSKLLKTDILAHASEGALWMTYLDALFVQDILEGAKTAYGQEETLAAYEDWRRRLTHAHFGLSTFFITQNGAAKGGIRLGPTLVSLLQQDKPVSVSMAFAFAALLRWLTPVSATPAASNGIYRGWLNQSDRIAASESLAKGEMYADGLSYSLNEGWYEFKCACSVSKPGTDDSTPVSEWLGELAATPQQPQAYVNAIRAYLRAGDGGNLRSVASLAAFEDFVRAVATLYARMVAGDGMVQLLDEMNTDNSIYENGLKTDSQVLTDSESLQNGQPLMFRPSCIPDSSQLMQYKVTNETIASTVTAEVASVMAIDLHTHLLPPSHGALCCWGIDELLTYVSAFPFCVLADCATQPY